MRRMRRACLSAAAALSVFATSAALAQTPAEKARAKEAYDRGVEAHKRGDYQRAAEEFAKADAIAPSAVALQAAVDESMDADDPALGAELIERSARAPATGDLAKSLDAAKRKFAGRAGRLKVGCPEGASCLATLDGAAIAVGKPVWSRSGQHTVVVQVDGEAQTKLVDVKADQVADVTPSAKSTTPAGTQATPPPPPPAYTPTTTGTPTSPTTPPPKGERADGTSGRKGLPPIVFWAGAGVTVLLGGASIALAVVTKSKHDEFVSAGCDQAANAGCKDKSDIGETLQILADAGFGATALAGIATIVIGVALTDWGAKTVGTSGTPVVAPVRGGATAGWRTTF
jgi:hypothetical protein